MLVSGLDKVLGVELKFLEENLISCRFLLVSRQGNKVDFEKGRQMVGNLVEVLDSLPKKYPVALSLTGKGVLNKHVEVDAGDGNKALFGYAFAAVEQKDFYVQEFLDGQRGLVSIIRRQFVEELLERMERCGLKVYSLSLGAMPTVHIWAQLKNDASVVGFDGHVFSLNNAGRFLSYQMGEVSGSDLEFKEGGLTIAQQQVLAYASAFQLLLHDRLEVVNTDVDSVNLRFANFLSLSALRKKGLYFLVSLFVCLIVSFVLFWNYNAENERLLNLQGERTAGEDQRATLQQGVLESEMGLKQLNWNGGYNYGFLLNEVGSTVPMQIRLKEIGINAYRSEKEKSERLPLIWVSGTSSDALRVNNWIFELKKKAWVKSVILISYQKDLQGGGNVFTLTISY